MKVLVILQMRLTLDVVELGSKLHLEVTRNSIPKEEEGIAIFDCGKPIPDFDYDFVVKVGDCEAYPALQVNEHIPSDIDWQAILVAQLEALIDGTVESGFESE